MDLITAENELMASIVNNALRLRVDHDDPVYEQASVLAIDGYLVSEIEMEEGTYRVLPDGRKLSDSNTVYYETFALTHKGLCAVEAFEHKTAEQAETKREKRFNRKIAILNLLVPFVTFLVGVVLEYYANLVSWVLGVVK